MSDTDDTDILLSIPPHTFLPITSESEVETVRPKHRKNTKKKSQNRHVENIAVQVDKLRSSLEKLENIYRSETPSFNILDQKSFNYCIKKDTTNPYDLYSSSECSNISFLSITSAINMETNDTDKCQTPVKGEDKSMLNEIDLFLKNVDIVSDVDQSSYLESPMKITKSIPTSKETFVPNSSVFGHNKKHSQQNYEDAERYDVEKKWSKVSITGDGYLKDSVPDYGSGMRDIMYSEPSKVEQPLLVSQKVSQVSCSVPSVSKTNDFDNNVKKSKSDTLQNIQSAQHVNSVNSRRKLDLNSVNVAGEKMTTKNFVTNVTSTPNIRANYPGAYKTQSQFYDDSNYTISTLNDSNVIPKTLDKKSVFENFNFQNNDKQQPSSLPSLSNLWNVAERKSSQDFTNFQKYEEEKIRREHCERNIEELQKKILEQQQKLAIAIQVDMSKDEAINKLKASIVMMMRKIEFEEEKYIQQINEINSKLRVILNENNLLKKKMEENKEETERAQRFVKEYQDRIRLSNSEKDEIISKLQGEIASHKATLGKKDDLYNELKESNHLVVQLNKQMSETLSNMRLGMDKLTEENVKLSEEVEELKKNAENVEDDITLLKTEKKEMSLKMSEEKSRNTHLETQKTKLQSMLDGANLKYKNLEIEYQSLREQADKQKDEMKAYFQKQVENIVMAKVNEFQNQLNAAESLMENEIQNKEKEIAVQFAKQLQKVEQQHKTEVNILEEKHKEEIQLYRLQLAQSSQTIKQLQRDLNSYKNKRGQIAAQLHNVMENNWKEALKIITNSSHTALPSINSSADSQQTDNNCNENSTRVDEGDSDPKKNKVSDDRLMDFLKTEKALESVKKCGNDGDVKIPSLSEDEIQHYVKMLLQRSPGISDILKTDPSDRNKGPKSKHSPSSNHNRQPSHEDDYPTSDKPFFYKKEKKRRPWK